MTPTAQELWNNIHFCRLRYWQQFRYLQSLCFKRLRGEIGLERYLEVRESAQVIMARFLNRIVELRENP